jgi:hypothetical protein
LTRKSENKKTPSSTCKLASFIGVKLVGKPKKRDRNVSTVTYPMGGAYPQILTNSMQRYPQKCSERYEEKVQKQDAKKRSSITSETLDSTSLEPISPLATMSYINNVGRGGMEIEENLLMQLTFWLRFNNLNR